MDFTLVLLILILIVILYLFYVYFIASSKKLVSSIYLYDSTTAVTITDSPTVTNFSLGLWVYINSWNINQGKASTTNLFTLSNGTAPLVSLDLGTTSPVLTTTVSLTGSATSQVVNLTNNMPIQKWVFVIISVSNNIVDGYLDGRLVTSYQLPLGSQINVSGASSLTLNMGTGLDIYVYNFQRWAYPMDPQTAQSAYYYGAPSAKSMMDYNLTVAVTKDGSAYSSMSIF